MLKNHILNMPEQNGSALLEGLIAILIFSFGILALVGLQASSMKATTSAKDRVDASLVANQRIANIWADIAHISSYAETDTDITSLPNGKRTTTVNGSVITVTVKWRPPAATSDNSYVTSANIVGN